MRLSRRFGPFWVRTIASSLLAATLGASSLSAQAIRGTALDGATGNPLPDALVTLIDSAGADIAAVTARTDARGAFVLYAPGPGGFKVRATRIGYAPSTSALVRLANAEIAKLLIPMAGVTQTVAPITVIEKRAMSAVELDGRLGFEFRRARAFGHYADSADFVGKAQLEDILASGKLGFITVPTSGAAPSRAGMPDPGALQIGACTGKDAMLMLDGNLIQQSDFQGQMAPDWARLEGSVVMPDVAAIEVYNRGELPLGATGFAASTINRAGDRDPATGVQNPPRGAANLCVLLVWTKGYFASMDSSAARGAENEPGHVAARQIVRGHVLEYETEVPVALAQITLVTPAGEPVGAPVYSDSTGRFSIPVPKAGRYHVKAMRLGYKPIISPMYEVEANSITDTEVHISQTAVVLAPLAIREKVIGRGSDVLDPMFGFEFRMATATGSFLTKQQLEDRNLTKFSSTLAGMAGVILKGDSVMMRGDPRCQISTNADPDQAREILDAAGCDPDLAGSGLCQPSVTLDGVSQRGDPVEVFGAMDMLLPDGIEGIEVYSSYLRVPGEIVASAGGYRCGAIAVWRRK